MVRMMLQWLFVSSFILLLSNHLEAYSLDESNINEPAVTFICGKPSKYYSVETLKWEADETQDCLLDPEDILSYCQRKYPDKGVTYILPGQTEVQIDNWCLFGSSECSERSHSKHTVKPYRCLSGNFQSDALLVPEHCQFGHQTTLPNALFNSAIKDKSKHQVCELFPVWNRTAHFICESSQQQLQSFGVLFPCKPDSVHQAMYFSGVEYVCCPGKAAVAYPNGADQQQAAASGSVINQKDNNNNAADQAKKPSQEDFLNYIKETFDDETDWSNEHARYAKAKACLHRYHTYQQNAWIQSLTEGEKVVQNLRESNFPEADGEEGKLHENFQKSFSALLLDQLGQRRQLDTTHQQRVSNRLKKIKQNANAELDRLLKAFGTGDAQYAVDSSSMKEELTAAMRNAFVAIQKDRIQSVNHLDRLRIADPERAADDLSNIRNHFNDLKRDLMELKNKVESIPLYRDEVLQEYVKLQENYKYVDDSISRTITEPIRPSKSDDMIAEAEKVYAEYVPKDNHNDHHQAALPLSPEESPNSINSNNFPGFVVHNLQNDVDKVEVPKKIHNSHPSRQQHTFHLSIVSMVIITVSLVFVCLIGLGFCVFYLRNKSCNAFRPTTKRGYTLTVLEEEANYRHNTGGLDLEAERLKHMQVNGFENPTYKFFEHNLPK